MRLPYTVFAVASEFVRRKGGAVLQGVRGLWPPMKNVPSVAPTFGPASLDLYLNRPAISLIQLHIVPPAGIVVPIAPIWLVPEPPLA